MKSYLVMQWRESHDNQESCDGKVTCAICEKLFKEEQLVIDHIDNDPLNWAPINLQLACRKCNYEKNPPKFYNLKGKSIDNLSGGEREGGRDVVNEFINKNLRVDSFTIWKNRVSEPAFQKWLKQEMTKKLRMRWKDVINSGAYIAECSPKTTEVYLNKLSSPEGPYHDYTDPDTHEKWIEWKIKHHPYKNKINKYGTNKL